MMAPMWIRERSRIGLEGLATDKYHGDTGVGPFQRGQMKRIDKAAHAHAAIPLQVVRLPAEPRQRRATLATPAERQPLGRHDEFKQTNSPGSLQRFGLRFQPERIEGVFRDAPVFCRKLTAAFIVHVSPPFSLIIIS